MKHRSISLRSGLGIAVAIALCAVLSACIGAVRLPARGRGPTGEQLPKNELDLGFLESPRLQRDDVVNKFALVDTGYHDPHLFWGRWVESKWGYWWVITTGQAAAGDAKRVWHVKNLLVTFDENGAVQSKRLIDDEKILWRQLHEAIAHEPAVDLTEPEVVALRCSCSSMTLASGGLEFLVTKGRFTVAADKIVRFSHEGSPDKRTNAGITCHTLHFSEKTPVGRKVMFCDTNVHLVGVFQYLNQTAPKTMLWE